MDQFFNGLSESLRYSHEASDKAHEVFNQLQKAYDQHDTRAIHRLTVQYNYWLNESLKFLEV